MAEQKAPQMQATLGLTGLTSNAMALIAPGAIFWLTFYIQATAGITGQPSTAPATTTTGAAGSAAASKPNPWYPDHAVYNATKDEMKAMPEFKYSAE